MDLPADEFGRPSLAQRVAATGVEISMQSLREVSISRHSDVNSQVHVVVRMFASPSPRKDALYGRHCGDTIYGVSHSIGTIDCQGSQSSRRVDNRS